MSFSSCGEGMEKRSCSPLAHFDVLRFFSAPLQKVMLREQMQLWQMSSNCPLHCYY